MPREMRRYLAYNGWHFNKKAYDFAASLMRKSEGGVTKNVKPYTKEEVDSMLSNNGIEVKEKGGWDYVFAATMCRADYFGSSIEDEYHMCLYIKDTCDDVDAGDGTTMRRWFATMTANGVGVPWDEIL